MTNNTEMQAFKLHPAILFEIINSQAGTPQKALLEAVMNAIDAGASQCNIDVTYKGFTVSDDGKGFGVGDEGRIAIESFFRTFGTPHVEGDARYGKFRMGRGQLMAFGVNVWRTGTFQMTVDIKHKDGYELKSELEPVIGCTISEVFYEPLLASEFSMLTRELEKMVAFSEIPITINKKLVSKLPSSVKWDQETDDAYFKFNKTGMLYVYNLGVLVCEHPSFKYGTGGTVVSKRRLTVNFARNDILLSKCDVWRKVVKTIQHYAGTEIVKKKTMTDNDRQFIANEMLAGNYSTHSEAKVITDVLGQNHVVGKLFYHCTPGVTVAPELHDSKGERIHSSKSAFVLSIETLERFGCETLEELKEKVEGIYPGHNKIDLLDFKKLAAQHTADFKILLPADLKSSEKIGYRAISSILTHFWHNYRTACRALDLATKDGPYYRKLQVGESDVAEAWTDGEQFIVLHRDLVNTVHQGLDSVNRILLVMLHEACHDVASIGTHEHDIEFFSRYHAVSLNPHFKLGSLAAMLLDSLTRLNRQENNKINNKTTMAASFTEANTQAEPIDLQLAA